MSMGIEFTNDYRCDLSSTLRAVCGIKLNGLIPQALRRGPPDSSAYGCVRDGRTKRDVNGYCAGSRSNCLPSYGPRTHESARRIRSDVSILCSGV